jgi:hypothetical protein
VLEDEFQGVIFAPVASFASVDGKIEFASARQYHWHRDAERYERYIP